MDLVGHRRACRHCQAASDGPRSKGHRLSALCSTCPVLWLRWLLLLKRLVLITGSMVSALTRLFCVSERARDMSATFLNCFVHLLVPLRALSRPAQPPLLVRLLGRTCALTQVYFAVAV